MQELWQLAWDVGDLCGSVEEKVGLAFGMNLLGWFHAKTAKLHKDRKEQFKFFAVLTKLCAFA